MYGGKPMIIEVYIMWRVTNRTCTSSNNNRSIVINGDQI